MGKPKNLEMFPRGSRILPNWEPSPEDNLYALNKGYAPHQIARMAEDFRDYWSEKTGKGATKITWAGTWRMWVRNDLDRKGDPKKRRDAKPPSERRMGTAIGSKEHDDLRQKWGA